MATQHHTNSYSGLEIAVIGMAGRFPGARNVRAFWENLKNGTESIAFFSDQELRSFGVEEALLQNPQYVKAKGALEGVEYFDAPFFNCTQREAKFMDPQLRVLSECVWHALEDAGYNPDQYPGAIGLYVGAGLNLPWISQFILKNYSPAELFDLSNLNDNGSFATAISYKLNLKGPAVNVNTACSTSLVSIHLACKSLLSGECNIALAGGVSVSLPAKSGYLYQDGMIFSPDGHCRAFDEQARGTVNGDGAGIVVLKPLEDALADRDTIYAVIKESAINNDGKRKVGYTAPSVKGQAEVIRTAQRAAGVEPESISYVEAHGTGTALGDPVEIEALRQAFGTQRKGFCAIGSVKSNIGHLDEAAGVTGFIKTVLALQHRIIPPSLHFEKPNPKIDFDNSPFYVNTQARAWKHDNYPLRAGVSSFGIGGTNAHVILEEAPVVETTASRRNGQLLLLSARTPASLDQLTEGLKTYLRENPAVDLADVAYTLQTGRKHFAHRRILVGQTTGDILESLRNNDPGRVKTAHSEAEPTVVFMFPGQGAQYVQMGRGLYQRLPVFRREVDHCLRLLAARTDCDLKNILYPSTDRPEASGQIHQTEVTQLALFVVEYALAKQLMHWGIRPGKMIGHSLGEYVAACLAGVFSLEDALQMVALRGKLMQQAQPGAMLSVKGSENALQSLLHEEVSIAAVNSTASCVVSGTYRGIDQLEKVLAEKGYESSRLQTSHAFHSPLMDPVVAHFTAGISQITFHPPQIPYISNVSGTWITAAEATDPRYWARQIRRPVQFAKGLEDLLTDEKTVWVEVGPGRTLSAFVKRHARYPPGQAVLNLLRHPLETAEDEYYLLHPLGQLWLHQVPVDWQAFYQDEKRNRVPLPLYPFDRKRHWPEDMPAGNTPPPDLIPASGKRTDPAEWFYQPVWQASPLAPPAGGGGEKHTWLWFGLDSPWEQPLRERLAQPPHRLVVVKPGPSFGCAADQTYTLNPAEPEEYKRLFRELIGRNTVPDRIVHAWSTADAPAQGFTWEAIASAQNLGFYSLINLAGAIGEAALSQPMQLSVLTRGLQAVTGQESVTPERATVLGPVKVIPQEYTNLTCRNIDLDPQGDAGGADRLWTELHTDASDLVVAFRNGQRWTPAYQPVPLAESTASAAFRQQGVYLVVGGLGGIGLSLAQYLAKTVQARLILVNRSGLPPRPEWDALLVTPAADPAVLAKIRAIREMEAAGAEVRVEPADVTDLEQMGRVVARATQRWGNVHGVFHCAGLAEGALMQRRTRDLSERVLAPKVKGVWVLEEVFSGREPDFMVLFSSLGNILYKEKVGQVAYNAANEFFDAYALSRRGRSRPRTVSINWEDWQQVGMSAKSAREWDQFLSAPADEGDDNFVVALSEGPGDLDALRFAYARRRKPGPGEVEVKVEAAALNFKDVLYALGVLPLPEDTTMRFGQECAGTVVAVGAGVTRVKAGDEVMALPGHSAFSAYVTLAAADVAPKPAHLRVEEAATVPVAFLTAYYALVTLGRLRQGERVLIHSAAGGVGLAAVKIAQLIGAEIYATAGNEEKRQYLQSIGVQHVMHSRSLDFADQVQLLTEGKGVDVVLNSLAGEYLFASIALLAPYGRFLELGVKDIYQNNRLEMRHFERGQSFFSVQMGPDLPGYQSVWEEVVQLFRDQKLAPLPHRVFPVANLREAFGYMTQGQHIGKIVLSFGEEAAVFKQVLPEGKAIKRAPGKRKPGGVLNSFQQKLQQEGLVPAEGFEALHRILQSGQARMAVSPSPLEELIRKQSYVSQLLAQGGLTRTADPAAAGTSASPVPDEDLEAVLSRVVADFFGLDHVAPDANFFELGATSLDIIQVNSRVNQALRRDIPFVTLYKHQTLAELAAFLRRDASPQPAEPAPQADRKEELKKGKEGAQQRLKLRKNLNNT